MLCGYLAERILYEDRYEEETGFFPAPSQPILLDVKDCYRKIWIFYLPDIVIKTFFFSYALSCVPYRGACPFVRDGKEEKKMNTEKRSVHPDTEEEKGKEDRNTIGPTVLIRGPVQNGEADAYLHELVQAAADLIRRRLQ